MNRCKPPSSATMFFVIPGYRDSRLESRSRSVEPSASTRASPPACFRRIVGSFTRTDIWVVTPPSLHGGRHAVLRLGRGLPRRQATEGLVVDELGDRRFLPAHRAIGIPPDAYGGEVHGLGIEQQQPADQRLAYAGDQLDGLRGLDAPHDAGEHAEHASFRARRD